LSGRWEDVLIFIEPLARVRPALYPPLRFGIAQQWFFELLVGVEPRERTRALLTSSNPERTRALRVVAGERTWFDRVAGTGRDGRSVAGCWGA
jgi:hypothetical protein